MVVVVVVDYPTSTPRLYSHLYSHHDYHHVCLRYVGERSEDESQGIGVEGVYVRGGGSWLRGVSEGVS